jgi:cyclophilin family peptidyl-prolyl cis-trans isomerase
LKKQDDPLSPEVHESSGIVEWTSGLIYGKGVGIIALETEYGAIRIKLLPDCAPQSVAYILELLKLHHCAGCRFYRAEKRGNSWDINGDRIFQSPPGPPYALLQGALEAQGIDFEEIPKETCPSIKKGAVAWIDGGPDFFISLANHDEWDRKYTVFASVIPEDMSIIEKIVELPTTSAIWSGIKVAVLEKYISLKLKRVVENETQRSSLEET